MPSLDCGEAAEESGLIGTVPCTPRSICAGPWVAPSADAPDDGSCAASAVVGSATVAVFSPQRERRDISHWLRQPH